MSRHYYRQRYGQSAPRNMQAKHAGTCTACPKPIQQGDSIVWTPGKGAAHLACHKPTGNNASHEDACCSDTAYEDACAAACGAGL